MRDDIIEYIKAEIKNRAENERSFNKLSDDSKIFYKEKFKNVMEIL